MRVEKTQSSQMKSTRRRSSVDGAAFEEALAGTGSTNQAASVSSARPVSPVAALMALQGSESETAPPETVARRGRQLLDALDGIQIARLSGTSVSELAIRLRGVLRTARLLSGQSGLDDTIRQIEVRAEVELAKLDLQANR